MVVEGDDELQLADPPGAVPPDGVGLRHRRSGGRRPGIDGDRLPGPRLLGRRHLRPSLPGRHPSGRCQGHARIPPAAASGRHGGGARRTIESGHGFRGNRPAPVVDVTPTQRPGPSRTDHSHPHRPARRTHRGRRGLGGLLLRGLVRRRRVRPGAGPPDPGRDGSLLGVSDPRHDGRKRPHLRGHRARRVPRVGRRQRLYERHGPMEPATSGRERWHRRRRNGGDGSNSPSALVDGYDPDTGIYEQFAGFGQARTFDH